jgi:predicted branched-subunit amino acid permease
MVLDDRLGADLRQAAPLFLPTAAIGVTFGTLAEPVMGPWAPIVMSVVVFAGSAQFAALSVLAAGGGFAPATLAGLLMNSRFLPMGLAIASSFKGGRFARALQGQTIVDASFVLASTGDGRFDRRTLFTATAVQGAGWWLGTIAGVVLGARIPEPETFGLDVIFPAFYLALLWPELETPVRKVVTLLGAALTLALTPVLPAGLPILAAGLAALIGLKWGDR